jgi:hypothetical protein
MLDANPQDRVVVRRQGPTPAPSAPPTPEQWRLAPSPPAPPGSEEQIHALAMQRGELREQIESLTDRREEVADQLHGAEQAARPGLLARLNALDGRIADLEAQLLQTDDAIAAGISAGFVVPPIDQTGSLFEQPEAPRFSEESINIMVGEALAFFLLAIAMYRLGMRRARAKLAGAGAPSATRMDQLQNSVDAIAVEVERISEGQRYVTKVLNEGSAPAVPVSAGHEEGVPVRRKAT